MIYKVKIKLNKDYIGILSEEILIAAISEKEIKEYLNDTGIVVKILSIKKNQYIKEAIIYENHKSMEHAK